MLGSFVEDRFAELKKSVDQRLYVVRLLTCAIASRSVSISVSVFMPTSGRNEHVDAIRLALTERISQRRLREQLGRVDRVVHVVDGRDRIGGAEVDDRIDTENVAHTSIGRRVCLLPTSRSQNP